MRNVHDIIIRPIITENSMDMLQDKKYTFAVKIFFFFVSFGIDFFC